MQGICRYCSTICSSDMAAGGYMEERVDDERYVTQTITTSIGVTQRFNLKLTNLRREMEQYHRICGENSKGQLLTVSYH